MTVLQVAAWVALGFVGLLGATILVWIWTGRINLNRVISEPNGDASLSRLQFLIFTFVIATSLFLVVASQPNGPGFTEIPQGVFMLLGISGSSYLVSKSIQFSSDEGIKERPVEVVITTDDPTLKPGETLQFNAVVKRAANQTVAWSLEEPAAGTIDAKTGLYTAPRTGPASDTVRATSVADPDASDQGQVTVVAVKGAAA